MMSLEKKDSKMLALTLIWLILIRQWICFPPILFLPALSHNNIHFLNVLLNLESYSTYSTTFSSTLSLASTHKNTSSSITLLPPGHLLLVPLYTNRSLARLRCGGYIGAEEDASLEDHLCCVDANLSNGNANGNVFWNPLN